MAGSRRRLDGPRSLYELYRRDQLTSSEGRDRAGSRQDQQEIHRRAFRRLHRRPYPQDSGTGPQDLEGGRGGQLRDRQPELDRRHGRGVQGHLRLRSSPLPARTPGSGRRQRGPVGQVPLGPQAPRGRPGGLRLCRRPAGRMPQAWHGKLARELRPLGLPQRIPDVRRTVRPDRRRVLERRQPGRHREQGGLLLRAHLREEPDLGGVLHRGRPSVQPLPAHDEAEGRPLLLRRDKRHPAASLHPAA